MFNMENKQEILMLIQFLENFIKNADNDTLDLLLKEIKEKYRTLNLEEIIKKLKS